MTARRHVLLLIFSIAVFAAVVALVSLGIVSSRKSRDFRYGIERLDALIRQDKVAEGIALFNELSAAARSAENHLSVLKRALTLNARGADVPLMKITQAAHADHPRDDRVHNLAVYASLATGNGDQAVLLATSADMAPAPELLAWALLESGAELPDESVFNGWGYTEDDRTYIRLVSLDRSSSPLEFELAGELTNDWRYSRNAAVLHATNGAMVDARGVVDRESLASHAPLLAADVYLDSDAPLEALSALYSAGNSPEVALRRADAYLMIDDVEAARRLYEAVLQSSPNASPVVYTNLAWIESDHAASLDLYNQATARFPGSWAPFEQRALLIAQNDASAALESLSGYTGPDRAAKTEYLRLLLAPRFTPEMSSQVWSLLSLDVSEPGSRLAAWYFTQFRMYEDLDLLLSRVSPRWLWPHLYSGVLASHRGDWGSALRHFREVHKNDSAWYHAYNYSIAHFASGILTEGQQLLGEAENRAESAGFPPESAVVFTAKAQIASDPVAAFEAASQALVLDPTNARALLLRDALRVR